MDRETALEKAKALARAALHRLVVRAGPTHEVSGRHTPGQQNGPDAWAPEPPTLEVFFRSETFGRRKPEALNRLRQSNIVPIPLLKEPTLSGRVY